MIPGSFTPKVFRMAEMVSLDAFNVCAARVAMSVLQRRSLHARKHSERGFVPNR